jgi:hypothetical protein
MIAGLTIQIVAEHNRLHYILGPESCIVSPNRAIEEFPAGFDRTLRATRREDRYE